MSKQPTAPELGEQTDVDVSAEQIRAAVAGDGPGSGNPGSDGEMTMETPDDLGGTGGANAGGAG